jgi:predicted amidohydrolase YtcJ
VGGREPRDHERPAPGAAERFTPFEALRAVTADAAWQNFEEGRKGTLEAGKLADMVICPTIPWRSTRWPSRTFACWRPSRKATRCTQPRADGASDEQGRGDYA